MADVLLLNNSKVIEESSVGAKAANLGRLKLSGFPVPKGFCITGDVYRKHIEQNKLTSQIQSAIKAPQDDISEKLNKLRTAIVKSTFCESTKKEIDKQFHLLNSDYVAVRSSATAEDLPGQSFAGQYETFLGIKNSDQCIKTIKKCWASLCIIKT